MRKKFKGLLFMLAAMLLQQPLPIYAVGVDEGALANLVDSFVSPVLNYAMVLIPVAAAVACGVTYLMWLSKDENEKESKPVGKSVKRIIFWAVIIEAVPAILKIFGL